MANKGERSQIFAWLLALAVAVGVGLPLGWTTWNNVTDSMNTSAMASTWVATGDKAFSEGLFGQALSSYARGASLNPGRKDILDRLARTRIYNVAWRPNLLSQTNLDDLLVDVENTKTVFPADVGIANAVAGMVASAMGRGQTAEDTFNEILKTDQSNGPAHLGLALYLRTKTTSMDSAIDHLKKSIDVAPKDVAARLSALLAPMLANSGDADGAVSRWEAALAYQEDAQWLAGYGNLLLLMGNNDKAISTLTRSDEIQPNNPDALSNLGQAYLALNKNEEAVGVLGKAMAARQDSTTAMRLAVGLNRLGKFSDSFQILSSLVQSGPDVMTMYEYGIAAVGVGNANEARKAFTAVLSVQADPSSQMGAAIGQMQKQAEIQLSKIPPVVQPTVR